MSRFVAIAIFAVSALAVLAPSDAWAVCGEDNQSPCRREVPSCFTDDFGMAYCGFDYEYFCHQGLAVEGWWNKVCKNRRRGAGLECCTEVNYMDRYGESSTKVTEGYYAKVDLTKAWIIIPDTNNPNWCSPTAEYKNSVMTIKDWAEYGVYNARVFINANFFDPGRNPYLFTCNNGLGLSISNKSILSKPGKVHGQPTASLIFFTPKEVRSRGIEAMILYHAKKYYGRAIQNAISGFWLLRNGAYVTQPSAITPNEKRPRTAVGLSADGNTLYLVVVNPGHDDSSLPGGTTLEGLADYLNSLGADDALTLDGSGSSQLYFYDPKTGKKFQTKPSDTDCPGLFATNPCYRPVPVFLGIQ